MNNNTNTEEIINNFFGIPDIIGIDKNKCVISVGDCDFKFDLIHNDMCIFSMDFFKPSEELLSLRKKNILQLNLLFTSEIFQKKGIGSYYMGKLVEFAKHLNVTLINIVLNPDDEVFKNTSKKNAMSKEKLRSFYKKFEDNEVEIKFIK